MDGYVTIGTNLDTKSFDAQIDYVESQLQEIEDKLKQADMGLEVGDTMKLEAQYEKLSQKLSTLRQKQADLNKTDLSNVQKSIDNVGNSTSNVIKKVGKWALAVFSVRSAYMFVRQSASTLSQYNEKIGADLEYIRFALASSLQPIIEGLIQLVYKLLTYVNYIAKAWFGVDLFANASAKAMNKGAKSAEKMKKSLAGFDEMNIMQDTTGGGADGGATAPSIDLSQWQGEVPSWIKWIADHGREVAIILGLIGTAIVGIKLAKFIKGFTEVIGLFKSFKAGIGLIIAGIALLSGNIINMILNWDTMTKKEKVLSATLAAIGAAFIALGYAIAAGISAATLGIGAIIAAVVALVTALGTLIYKWATEEKSIKDVTTAQEDLKKAQDEYANTQDEYIDAVDRATEAFNKLNEIQKETGISGEDLYNQVQNGTLDYADMTEQQKEVYKAYLDNIKAQDNLTNSTKQLEKAKKKEKEASWDLQLATAAEKGEFNNYKKAVIDAFNKGELSAEEARDAIGKAMSEMSTSSQKTFMEDLPNDVKNGLDPKNYETTGQKLKNWFGDLWDGIKKGASNAWSKVKGWFGFSSGGVTTGRTSGFATGGITVPRLAVGGIINQPGRGVPLTSAIGGERGQEGIIPLTNSQMMAQLGEAIGKYVNINATVPVYVGNRQIAREIKKISADSDFAFNR